MQLDVQVSPLPFVRDIFTRYGTDCRGNILLEFWSSLIFGPVTFGHTEMGIGNHPLPYTVYKGQSIAMINQVVFVNKHNLKRGCLGSNEYGNQMLTAKGSYQV